MAKRKRVGGRQKGVNVSWENRFTEAEIRELARAGATCTKVEAGRIMGRHPDTIASWARGGKIPSFKNGNQRYYNVRALAKLIGVEV